MYHISAGKKSIIMHIPVNFRTETDMLPIFLPREAGTVKKKEKIPAGKNSILYNLILTENNWHEKSTV